MNLVNTELSKNTTSDKQIFITSFNGENNILMACKDVEETKDWEKAIQAHISFANKQTEDVVRSSRRFESSPVPASSTGETAATVGASSE